MKQNVPDVKQCFGSEWCGSVGKIYVKSILFEIITYEKVSEIPITSSQISSYFVISKFYRFDAHFDSTIILPSSSLDRMYQDYIVESFLVV